MDDANRIEPQGEAVAAGVPRRKPGPRKKEKPRDEKISCRLTKEEKAEGEKCCREHGITEAKLLRASYLAATAQAPDAKFEGIAETIGRLFSNAAASSAIEQTALKSRIKDILKKSAFVFALILFGFFLSATPTVAKYILHLYESGITIIYGPHESCIYRTDENGCEMVPYK